MRKFKFGDIVREVKINIDRNNNPYEYFIAGEHMDSEDIHIHRRGKFEGSDVGPAFTRLFKPGQILYGSRRTYLKKVAVADFEGITSNTTFVLESKDENVFCQGLLPFIMLSDDFTQYSILKSKGSTNPYILFSDLRDYEIELPEIERQRELSNLLWTLDKTKSAYKKQIFATDELVKSQFIEMFGDPVFLDKKWDIMTIGDVATSQLGKMLNAKNQTGKHPHLYLANRNVQWFSLDLDDLRTMDFDEQECIKYELKEDDLLVCEGGEIGRCAIWHNEIADCYIQNAVHRVRCNQDIIIPIFLGYLLYYHAQENGFSDIVGSKSTIAHLPADKLRAMKIIVPPIDLQRQFESFVEQSDKSKFVVAKYSNRNLSRCFQMRQLEGLMRFQP